jgi:hypothetical protein
LVFERVQVLVVWSERSAKILVSGRADDTESSAIGGAGVKVGSAIVEERNRIVEEPGPIVIAEVSGVKAIGGPEDSEEDSEERRRSPIVVGGSQKFFCTMPPSHSTTIAVLGRTAK